jgi:hypothetical protein
MDNSSLRAMIFKYWLIPLFVLYGGVQGGRILEFSGGESIPPAICGIRAQNVSDTPPSAGCTCPPQKGKPVPRNAPEKPDIACLY